MKARAQTEILGFAMVVLLITVGLLFIVAFVVLNPAKDIRRVYTDKQLAVNLNDAILSATSTCKDLSYERLIVDCAGMQQITCDPTNTVRSCAALEADLRDIFSKTLEVWAKEYTYTISRYPTNEQIMAIGTPCAGELEPGIFTLPTVNGAVIVRLDVCG